MPSGRASRIALLVSCLSSAACATSQPAAEPIDKVSAQLIDPDGTKVDLQVDKAKVIACVKTAKEVPIDRVAKAALKEGEYELRLVSASKTRVLGLFNSQNFTEGELFFETDCLYELVHQPT